MVNSGAVMAAGALTTVRDLAIVVPGGTGMDGLRLSGTAENVAITPAAGAVSPTGVVVADGASFAHGALAMPGGTGASLQGGSTLADSRVSGLYAIQASGSPVMVRRSRLAGSSYGILAYYAALTVEDTIVDLGGSSGTGIMSAANVNGSATAALRHVTIVHGAPGAVAVSIDASSGKASTATLRDSVIAGVGHAISLTAAGAGSVASLTTSFSSYETAGVLRSGSGGAATPALQPASNPLSTTPGFVDAAAGDWRLRHDSPLVDAATPGALAAGESVTDADGLPRVIGGRRDAGAFEYQRRAPVVTATAGATSTVAGEAVAFTGSATDPDPGEAIAGYQWTFDDGTAVPAGAGATHAFATPGVHTATLTAVDAAGVPGAAGVSVTVVAAASPDGPPPVTGPRVVPVKPVLSALALSPRAFRSGTGTGRGTRLTYKLSAPAQVTFRVQRAVTGRLRGTTCSTAQTAGGRRCTKYVTVTGKLTQAGRTGANTLRFSGRIGGHALKPGAYRLVARAGSEPVVRAAFRIAAAPAKKR